jgi:NAD(P)-dependent dehydrogenase (short-subunit alcohol dehydrogenase family)
MRDSPRTVLTTGANSGIGLASVIELARRGFRSVGSVRSHEKADVLAKAAAEAGVEVEPVLLDVTDAERCREVVAGLDLYGLVNNAGYGVTGAVEDVDDDEARQLLETMVVAPTRLARLALPGMRARGDGRIVNVSSIAGRATSPLAGWYAAAKHALEAVSDALRAEVAGAGVKVVLVEPGGFKTNIWDDFDRDIEKREGSQFMGAYRRSLQGQRLAERIMGEPAQVAKIIASAVEGRNPRARYLVGIDAQLMALTDQLTPTVIKDRIFRIALGL